MIRRHRTTPRATGEVVWVDERLLVQQLEQQPDGSLRPRLVYQIGWDASDQELGLALMRLGNVEVDYSESSDVGAASGVDLANVEPEAATRRPPKAIVSFALFEETVEITPLRKKGGGWIGKVSDRVLVEDPEAMLGASLREALGLPRRNDATPDARKHQRVGASETIGHRSAWLAISAGEPEDVASMLELKVLGHVEWREALVRFSSRAGPSALLSPAVSGWVVVVLGGAVWEADGSLQLAGLSARFGEAQKFLSSDNVGACELQRWIDGRNVRHFLCDDDEVRIDLGQMDAAERAIRARARDRCLMADEMLWLAEEWSLNPNSILDTTTIDHALLGEFEVPPLRWTGRATRR